MNTKGKATKAAFYMRVSTDEQTTENQRPDLERVAEARGLEVVEIFSENVSAVKARPQLDLMLSAAHRGRYSVLIVWSLDRLHRSMVGALQTVLDLDRRGVQVVSVREPWLDTGGPVRSLLIAIFGWVAEQERARISERTKAGLERARRRGVKLGRRPVDVDLVRLLALRAEGKSIRAIAANVGLSVGKTHQLLRAAGVQEPPGLGTPKTPAP